MKAPAFNGRFEPASVGAYPLNAVIGVVVALLCTTLTILFPFLIVKLSTGSIAVAAIGVAVVYLRLGDSVVFSTVMYEAWAERHLRTHDYRAEE